MLVVLFMTATAVAAQESDAPSQPDVNWLCDNAFVQAELDLAAGTLDADPATDPTSSPSTDRDPSFLDGAIRACASVADFTAGAALHPVLVGDIDPIAWLGERCRAPDLAEYSTCVSLLHALATPPPSPRPTPVPTATPPPTQRPTRTRPKATSRPPPTGSSRGGVKVPAVRAKVPGVTRIHYFEVSGSTWNQLNRSTGKRTSQLCRNHAARACLETRITGIQPRYAIDPGSGSCTITGVDATLVTIAHMPRWTAPRRVARDLAWVWRKSIKRTGWHEAQHAKIAKQHFRRLPGMLRGKPCAKFGRITQRWWKRLTRAQDRFDRRDYVKSAEVHASWWLQAYQRFGR